MSEVTFEVPVSGRPKPTVIALSFRDDPADLSPSAVTVRYARWRMPTEMPVHRPRGENPRIDAAQGRWDEREELAMRGVLAELLEPLRDCCDPMPADITWTRSGGRLVADCALTRDGHLIDLVISEPGR